MMKVELWHVLTSREVIAAVIVLLVVSLAIFSWYRQRRDKQLTLRIMDVTVAIMPVFPVDNKVGGFDSVDGPGISLRLQNAGEKEIRLASVFLCKRIHWRRHACTELRLANIYSVLGSMEAGTSRTFVFYVPDTSFMFTRRMYIAVEDATGHHYRSRPVRI
jgi:hypothetical protein